MFLLVSIGALLSDDMGTNCFGLSGGLAKKESCDSSGGCVSGVASSMSLSNVLSEACAGG